MYAAAAQGLSSRSAGSRRRISLHGAVKAKLLAQRTRHASRAQSAGSYGTENAAAASAEISSPLLLVDDSSVTEDSSEPFVSETIDPSDCGGQGLDEYGCGPDMLPHHSSCDSAGEETWREETWLFLTAASSDLGVRRHSKRYEVFSISLVIALVVLDILFSMAQFHHLEESRIVLVFRDVAYAVFGTEYSLRLWSCVESPRYGNSPLLSRLRWAREFLPLVDLVVLVAYLLEKVNISGAQGFGALRMIRLLRLLSLLRVDRSTNSFSTIFLVFRKKRRELSASLASAFIIVLISSTLMFYAEREAQPDKFSSIPASMWWAIAALTTVGYGDLVPQTALGQVLGSVVGVFGVALFALPAGIVGSAYADIQQAAAAAHTKADLVRVKRRRTAPAHFMESAAGFGGDHGASRGAGRRASHCGVLALPPGGDAHCAPPLAAPPSGEAHCAPPVAGGALDGPAPSGAAAAPPGGPGGAPAPPLAGLDALRLVVEDLCASHAELRRGLGQLAAQQEELLRNQRELLRLHHASASAAAGAAAGAAARPPELAEA